MAEQYFSNFPLMVYANTICIDITKRVVMANNTAKDIFAYYPYEMKSHQRPDTISDKYYGNPYFSWLVYMANETLDPYYEYPLDSDTFNSFITKKYGGIANAQQLILYWSLNWAADIAPEITKEFYQNELPEVLRKYYEGIYGEGTNIIYYKRRESDWTTNTNRIVTFQIDEPTIPFLINETVRLKLDSNTVLSNSVVIFANTSEVKVQHVLGNTTLSNTGIEFLQGDDSGAEANVLNVIYTSNNISEDEQAFWSPVYAWDYENQKNEQNKFIYLVDSKYTYQIQNSFKKALNNG